jgi:hypothetical protein
VSARHQVDILTTEILDKEFDNKDDDIQRDSAEFDNLMENVQV